MGQNSRFEQEKAVKQYEKFYQTKYRKADLLEKKLLAQLFARFPETQSVLEIGSGTSHFTGWAQSELRLETVGVDSSRAMLKEAKALCPQCPLLLGDGVVLPLKDKSLDLVAFITSLEFIPDAEKAVTEAARVAKNGIIFGLMNKSSPCTIRKRVLAKTQRRSYYSQAKFYSLSEINGLLLKALAGNYKILLSKTAVFPKTLGSLEGSASPFGAFLGIAVKLGEVHG